MSYESQSSPWLVMAPMTPRAGSFARQRALAMGVSIALADLLNREGCPIQFSDLALPPVEDALAFIETAPPQASGVAVSGRYAPDRIFPLELIAIDMQSGRRLADTSLDPDPDSAIVHMITSLQPWLAALGQGIPETVEESEPPPRTPDEFKLQARALGMEWLILQVASVLDEEFQTALETTLEAFEAHLAEPFAARRLRGLLLYLVPIMQEKRAPHGLGPLGAALGAISTRMDPPGTDRILAILERGCMQERECASFHACRGLIQRELGHVDEALRDFDALQPRFPVHAWFYKALALEAAGRLDEAIAAYRSALAVAPDCLFVDIARAVDAVPVPGDEMWQPSLRGMLGRALLWNRQYEEAAAMLREALPGLQDKVATLENLCETYQRWADELPEGSPQRTQLASQFLMALDSLYELSPRTELVYAALEVAEGLELPAEQTKWLERQAVMASSVPH